MRCDLCIHWHVHDQWETQSAGFRRCGAVRERWRIEDEAVGDIDRFPEDEPTTEHCSEEVGVRWLEAHQRAFQSARAYVQDGSDYTAELLTGPDFFCALFSPTDAAAPGEADAGAEDRSASAH